MSVSRVNLGNPSSVGIYLRNIQHDDGLHAGNIPYVRSVLERRAVKVGQTFLDCARQDLREKITNADRQGVKDLINILMAEGLTLEDIRDAVTD
jgi:hypothetical protein